MEQLDDVLQELEARVARRRIEGKYPPGLERQLEAEFVAILEVVHRGDDSIGAIFQILAELREETRTLTGGFSSHSRIPGGSIVHRLIARVFGRPTRIVAQQVQSVLSRQLDLVEMMGNQFRIQRDADTRVLNQLEIAMRDRLMMVDALAEAILELERRMASK